MRYLWLNHGELSLRTTNRPLTLQELCDLCHASTIQQVSPWEDDLRISLYCDEEGKLNGAHPNFLLPSIDDIIMGPAVLICEDVRRAEDQQIDFTDEQLAHIKLIQGRTRRIPTLLYAVPTPA